MTQRFLLGFLVFLVLNLSACDPIQPIAPTKPDVDADQVAVQAEHSGDYITAAQEYARLAEKYKAAYQANYYLRSALSFWKADDVAQASTTLTKVNRDLLSNTHQLDADILEARIALIDSHAEQALRALEDINTDSVLSSSQKADILELRIQGYALTENWSEKANSHIELMPLLSESRQQEEQTPLWKALNNQTAHALELLNPGIAPDTASGWFALAYIVKEYQSNPDTFIVAIEDWKRNYPSHPADPQLYKSNLTSNTAISTQIPRNIDNIAVLLPESGPYKSAAAAIRKGIMAAHFHARSGVKLNFYDVSDSSQALQQYQSAVQQGASLVIGPLDKKSVQILADSAQLSVPVLALNRLSDNNYQSNLFQFGLAPEDDAITVANYAIRRGFRRAVMISPLNKWGHRIAKAFAEQWTQQGGALLNHKQYDPSQHDFSDVIKPLLGLDISEQRHRALEKETGQKIEFEPQARQDIDFIFVIAKPLKARQILPQLKFHRSGRIPVIATSQAFNGKEDPQQNIDLNGLYINDIPWMFARTAINDPVYASLTANPPENFERFLRLYALGADAYHLIPKLNSLTRSSDVTLQGATGILSVTQSGKIQRETRWGRFKKGILHPLSSR